VLLAEKETALQGMSDGMTGIGRCSGMEMNVEKTKVMRISRQLSAVHITIVQTHLYQSDMSQC